MASGGPMLLEQTRLVEGRLKTLINNDLRTICKAYNQMVSGTKVHLQQRCIDILHDIISKGDVARFQEFSGRVSNHGNPGPDSTQISRPVITINNIRTPLPQPGRLEYKSSPFYERVEAILRSHDLPEMPQNRHTIKINLVLGEDHARRLSSDSDQYRIMVYCTQPPLTYTPFVDIAFPPQIEIKVNDDDVKANYKGLKNKPGSTKPADITKFVRARAGYNNKLSVCYALTNKRYVISIWLVKYIKPETLVEKIRSNRVFPKQKVLEEINRLNADPDIAATSSKMSLKDPVSTMRITVPIRSTICSHNQCFDASFFLQLQEQAPTWQCPLCSKTISFESLCVDKYFDEILQNTARSIEQVTVEPDGTWKVIKDDEDKGLSNAAKGAPRASYDDDFDDDDLIELDADPQVKKDSNINAFNTPPLSSREPSVAQSQHKRTSAVIDLTLSDDDDDEPIRPNKRSRPEPPRPLPTPTSMNNMPFTSTAALPRPQGTSTAQTNGLSNGRMQSPITLPTYPSTASSATFGRPSEMGARGASHMSSTLNQWTNYPLSAPFGEGGDLNRRLSNSRSPLFWSDESARSDWLSPPSIANARPNPPQALLLRTQSYDQGQRLPSIAQTSSGSYGDNRHTFPPNYGPDPTSPG